MRSFYPTNSGRAKEQRMVWCSRARSLQERPACVKVNNDLVLCSLSYFGHRPDNLPSGMTLGIVVFVPVADHHSTMATEVPFESLERTNSSSSCLTSEQLKSEHSVTVMVSELLGAWQCFQLRWGRRAPHPGELGERRLIIEDKPPAWSFGFKYFRENSPDAHTWTWTRDDGRGSS